MAAMPMAPRLNRPAAAVPFQPPPYRAPPPRPVGPGSPQSGRPPAPPPATSKFNVSEPNVRIPMGPTSPRHNTINNYQNDTQAQQMQLKSMLAGTGMK